MNRWVVYGKYKTSNWLGGSSRADQYMAFASKLTFAGKMMGMDYMLDPFMVKWYQMVVGSRIRGYPNPTSDQSTYLSTLIPNVFAQGSDRRIKCVCVCVVSVWASAGNAELWWAEVGILEQLLPMFIPWKIQTQMSGFPVVHLILRERGHQKGTGDRRGERRKPPFEQVHLGYRGGRGRAEQAVPAGFPVTSVLTCRRTRPVWWEQRPSHLYLRTILLQVEN